MVLHRQGRQGPGKSELLPLLDFPKSSDRGVLGSMGDTVNQFPKLPHFPPQTLAKWPDSSIRSHALQYPHLKREDCLDKIQGAPCADTLWFHDFCKTN